MFLTLEDPRAKVQGSRDPLGVETIWSRFGREVVTNLTTVSRAVRGFAVLLLGRYFGARYVDEGRIGEEDVVSVFLRFEQIAAYVRHLATTGRDNDIVLGVTRVQRFLNESENRRVPIADNATGYILSDQRTYGLWGLYSVAARVSGLLADGPVGLTLVAREFVEREYLPKLSPVQSKLDTLLLSGGELSTGQHQQPFAAVSRILTGYLSKAERDFYCRFLRDAQHVERSGAAERQRQLAELLAVHGSANLDTGRTVLATISHAARQRGTDLADKLDRILRLEAVLAPAERLFELLLARNGQPVSTVARHVGEQWKGRVPHLETPLTSLMTEIQAAVGEEQSGLIACCDRALGEGAYEEAIRTLLDWNRVVMTGRDSAPWVMLNSGNLDVRFRGIEQSLPTGEDLAELWRNSYFVDSLKDVTFQLAGGIDGES